MVPGPPVPGPDGTLVPGPLVPGPLVSQTLNIWESPQLYNGNPDIALAPDGSSVVVWSYTDATWTSPSDGPPLPILGAQHTFIASFDPSGALVDEREIFLPNGGQVAVSIDATGSPAVVYFDHNSDGIITGVSAQLLYSSLAPVGAPITVFQGSAELVSSQVLIPGPPEPGPMVPGPDGSLVPGPLVPGPMVSQTLNTWESPQVYNSTPDIALAPDGSFVVVWSYTDATWAGVPPFPTLGAQHTFIESFDPSGVLLDTQEIPNEGSASVLVDHAGNRYTASISGDGVLVVPQLDQDAGEQAALSLTVNGGSPIGYRVASAVAFTVGGLEPDDNGTVSFTDGAHSQTVKIVSGVPAASTVNLSTLTDGTLTATLHLNDDAAGNTFTDIVVHPTLDQDTGEQSALSLSFVDTTILTAQSTNVHFTVDGLDSEDTAIVTFQDQLGATQTAQVSTNGTAAADLSGLADGTITASMQVVTDAAGNTFQSVSAGNTAMLDQDAGEQSALSLSFVDTTILTAQSTNVHFTVGGLDSEDTAIVTFQDQLGATQTAQVSANGMAAADLSGLADGTITASMQVVTDAAGNTFQPVSAGNTATLDQDAGEQAALALSFVDTTILTAHSTNVQFMVGGLDVEDTATVTFQDQLGATQTAQASANGTAAADLSGLADGTITASMQVVTDAAGNTFQPVSAGSTATLDRDAGEQAALSLTVNGGSPIGHGAASAVAFTVGGLESDDNGTVSFTDGAHTQTVKIVSGVPAASTVNLSALTDGALTATLHLNNDAADNTFADIVVHPTLDQDSGEQATLKLTVGNSNIGAAAAAAVPFAVAGLDSEDTGTVTFTDANHKTVTVNVRGGQTSYAANLKTLADGTITSQLSVNADSAGNTFTPVAGTAVTLDRDTGEQAALRLTVPSSAINAATAPAVAFTIAGLDSEDTGTVTFTDANHRTVALNVRGGQTSYTANLTNLADGAITSQLSVNPDSAGNTFTPVSGTSVTLTQLDHWLNGLGGGWATASNWTRGVPSATIDADIDASGTYTVRITSAHTAYSLLLNDAGATVSDNAGGTLALAGTGGSNGPNGALSINAGTFWLAGGGLNAGSISIASGGDLLLSQSYAGSTALAETINDNGAITIAKGSIADFTGAISGSGAVHVQDSAIATFSGAVTGSETFTITNNASAVMSTAISATGSFVLLKNGNLEFAAADSENVAFGPGATGTLKLDHSLTAPFTGQLSGLTANNTVDLADLTWSKKKMTATFAANAANPTSGGALTVSNGSQSVKLNLLGNYTQAAWNLSKDGSGGTLVVDPPRLLAPNPVGAARGGIDPSDISFSANTSLGYAANNDNTGGTLTVSDGAHAMGIALLGQYMASSFPLSGDGHWGAVATDPAMPLPLLAQPQHA
jgi:hypothetical protein